MNKIYIIWLSCILLIPSLVGIFNFIADPNYLFGNNSKINIYRSDYNERQMKINFLENTSLTKYDSLILGASRSTYLNSTSFKDEEVFNFSVSDMTSREFIDFTKFFEEKHSTPKDIYLFVDFIGMLLPQNSLIEESILNIDNPEYIFSSLLSFSTTRRSLYNLLWSYQKKTGHRAYLHNLDVVKDKVNIETSLANIDKISRKYYREYSNSKNIDKFSLAYKENLLQFAKEYNSADINVTTSPISNQLLDKIYSNDLLFESFILWISILCEVFDEINFMTYTNDFTINFAEHSWDGNHIYPESFNENFAVINKKNIQYTKLLTKKNLPAYIDELKVQRKNYKKK